MNESPERETTIMRCRDRARELMEKVREKGRELRKKIDDGTATDVDRRHHRDILERIQKYRSSEGA